MGTPAHTHRSTSRDATTQLVVFTLHGLRYALRLAAVERIVRAVEITPLPKAPEIVLGVINVRGEIIPVVNVRRRFRLPERELDLTDQLMIARTAKRKVALVVDAVTELIHCAEGQISEAETVLPSIEHVEGVARMRDGLIFVHDLDSFLSLEEEQILEETIAGTEH